MCFKSGMKSSDQMQLAQNNISSHLLLCIQSYEILLSARGRETLNYTGRFVMFYVITNIYNKKTKGPTLMELFTATGKLEKFFFDNQICSMCAPRVTLHTSIRYSSSCHTRVNTSNISSCQKKNFSIFPVAVNNSIKVCPLVYLS